MKQYPEIQGPSKAPNLPCIAFDKLDGSNLRFEYSQKQGWYKFGTRHTLFDETHSVFGCAISIFLNTLAEPIEKTIKDCKEYRGVKSLIAYCEFFGENSFAGWHETNDKKELILFDVNIHKKGFVPPRDFVNHFSKTKIPQVVYEGNFNKEFVNDVKENKYNLKEGVVAKGMINPRKLWMTKVKTKQWIDELKLKSQQNPEFLKALKDNQLEQG